MNSSPHKLATRLNSFRNHLGASLSVNDALSAISSVSGINAVELNYPQHFPEIDPGSVISAAQGNGLSVTAINLRFDGPGFASGAFTHPDPAQRERGIRIATAAVDLAERFSIPHVILWMGQDGFDYPFQVDYSQLWQWEIEGFRAIASRNPAILVSVEYKPSDPRRTSLIRTMSDSLLAVADVGLQNFGVTLDFCHALMAGEQPAAVAVQALSRGKLFGVHLNDGYGPADDGLMVGSVHLSQTLELLLELRVFGFQGTIYFDTFPERIDPAGETRANVESIRQLESVLDRFDLAALKEARSNQDGLLATGVVKAALLDLGAIR